MSLSKLDTSTQAMTMQKPIEQVRTGDWVATRDAASGRTEARQVVSTSQSHASVLIAITLTDGLTGQVVERIEATRQHPFYVEGKGFVPAGGLAVGNAIVTRAGPTLVVSKVEWERRAEGFAVYNFVVAEDHSCFVGTANGGVSSCRGGQEI